MSNKLDAFDLRMNAFDRAGAPRAEHDAAVRVYDRLRTAKAACIAEFGEPPPLDAVLAVFRQLCIEVQIGHDMRSDDV